MLQSNSEPLTAAAVFRACNEMEDESEWHCAKGYCQCNTTSVTAPVRKAMSVKRRCLERLSQNMPHWQIWRKELHPPEGKLVGLNLFSWVGHYQLPQLSEQPQSAAVLTGECARGRAALLVAESGLEGPHWLRESSSSAFFQQLHCIKRCETEICGDWESETDELR